MPTSSVPKWKSWLFAGLHGHVVALDPANGKEKWRTSLPSTGYSVASIVVEGDRLLCGSGGRVFALDPSDGTILWNNGMKGLGNGEIFLTTANSNSTEAMFALLARLEEARRAAAAGGGAAAATT